MTQIALHTKKSSRGIPLWIYGAGVLLVLLVIGGFVVVATNPFSGGGSSGSSFKTVPVRVGAFETRVVVRGDLQAVDNIDIVCQVEGSTAITQIVPEGTYVHKGDTLVVLDSSTIRQKLEDATIELQRGQADVTTAEEMLSIQKSQNAANLEAAEVALQLAEIDLTKYVEGSYPSLLADADMAMEKAATGLKTKEDDLAQTRALFAKGFVTATEVKNKELEVAAARRDVAKAVSDRKVLVEYSNKADLAAKKNALAQAEQKLERTKRENAANLSQKTADLSAKKQQLELITRRVSRFKEYFDACTILAPADGLVVYRNDNSRDSVQVQEGAQVRERQTLMRLPDTSRMKVQLKINESQIGGLAVDQLATIRLANHPTPLTGRVTKISPVADSADRWMNPDRKDYPVDVILDETPKGLRPGMSAEVSILIDRLEDAMSVPVAALYSSGADRYVFTPADNGATPVKVKIGKTNEQDVQIREGLSANQSVILLEAGQGKVLLERAGIKVVEAPPTDQPKRKRRDGAPNGGAPNATPNGTAPGGTTPASPTPNATPNGAAPSQAPAKPVDAAPKPATT